MQQQLLAQNLYRKPLSKTLGYREFVETIQKHLTNNMLYYIIIAEVSYL